MNYTNEELDIIEKYLRNDCDSLKSIQDATIQIRKYKDRNLENDLREKYKKKFIKATFGDSIWEGYVEDLYIEWPFIYVQSCYCLKKHNNSRICFENNRYPERYEFNLSNSQIKVINVSDFEEDLIVQINYKYEE